MRLTRRCSIRPMQYVVLLLLPPAIAFSQTIQPAPSTGASPSIKEPAAPMQPAPPAPPLIIIDPAHGGNDPGAQLTSAIPEKDVTLMFARRLQQQLQSRGVFSTLVRNADVTLSTDQRAALTNVGTAALYLCIHASSMGKGIRVFTAMLPVAVNNSGPFVNWQAAQTTSTGRSAWAQQQIVTAVQRMGFPARSLLAPLQPLNNVTIPALAIEIAPSTGNSLQLASPDYQDMVGAALASVIANLAPSLRSHSFQGPTAQPTAPRTSTP